MKFDRKHHRFPALFAPVTGLFALGGLLGAAGLAVAAVEDGWKLWQFGENERYELMMTDYSSGDAKPVGMILDLSPAKEPAADGERQVNVSYTTTTAVPLSELGPETAFGGAAGFGMGPAMMLMMNPMVGFMDQMTLAVGEKMALFGAGRIEITGKEKLAGIEGFVCKFFGPKQEDEPLQFEWVVNPDLAMPLRSVTYDGEGNKTWEIVLQKYEKR